MLLNIRSNLQRCPVTSNQVTAETNMLCPTRTLDDPPPVADIICQPAPSSTIEIHAPSIKYWSTELSPLIESIPIGPGVAEIVIDQSPLSTIDIFDPDSKLRRL